MNAPTTPARPNANESPSGSSGPSALKRYMPTIAIVVLSLVWGYTWVLSKQGLQYTGPFGFAAERCVGGALALMVVLKITGRSLRCPYPRHTFWIALVQVTGFMVFQTWALVEGGAGKTAVLIFTMPIWTLLLAWPILGERIRGKQWFAAFCTLAGLLLIIEPWAMQGSKFSKLLGVLAAISWAIGTILVKRLRSQHTVDLLSLTAWQLLLGSVPLVFLAAVIPENPTQWTLHYIGILAFITVISTAFGWLLWLYILSRAPAWEASLSVLGIPVVAILSSRLITGESFKWFEISGIVLIGTGLAFLSLLGWISTQRLRGR